MAKNYQSFPMEEAKHLAETPAGQQLMQLLRTSDGAQLDEAASLLQQGNIDQAKSRLLPLMEDPSIKALLRQLGG